MLFFALCAIAYIVNKQCYYYAFLLEYSLLYANSTFNK